LQVLGAAVVVQWLMWVVLLQAVFVVAGGAVGVGGNRRT